MKTAKVTVPPIAWSGKGRLCFLHYRRSPSELNNAERRLRQQRIFEFLMPVYGYLSVIEASLYEATAIAHRNLAQKGLNPTVDGWQPAFDAELSKQKNHLQQRVYRTIPEQQHICFYPMSKRRGEQVNWYDMSLEDRRLMRGHGRLGHKFHKMITQVVSGSTGLDEWEWAVDLHGDDPLQFKKLVYEMRFDPASSRFAMFGDFYIGLKTMLRPCVSSGQRLNTMSEFISRDPSTGLVLTEHPMLSKDQALQLAHTCAQAQQTWAQLSLLSAVLNCAPSLTAYVYMLKTWPN